MSAFLCSAAHISAIVNAVRLAAMNASTIESYLSPEARAVIYAGGQTPEDALFSMLLDANMAGMRERYSDVASENEAEQTMCYRATMAPLAALASIKLCHSFEYQACEWSGWPQSPARAFLDDLVARLTRKLPGYDACDWAIDDDHPATRVISLSALAAQKKAPSTSAGLTPAQKAAQTRKRNKAGG